MDEMYQAASSTAEALRKSPFEQSGSLTPFSCRHGVSIYDYYKQNPQKGARFAEAMQGATACECFSTKPLTITRPQLTEAVDDESMDSLRDSYPWAELGNSTIIDVAGGGGHVSMFLAKVSWVPLSLATPLWLRRLPFIA
jgi:hypothetical protein